MKKNIFTIFLFTVSALCTSSFCLAAQEEEENCSFSSVAFTTGYVFKHDHIFKEVYGHGIQNVITADACYYPKELWGIGAKLSYWRARGKTTFYKQCTCLREIPLTFYLRRLFDSCYEGLQGYASLGAGAIFIKEKSYLGRVKRTKGIGELELGFNYQTCGDLDITGAFRYLFPREKIRGQKHDVGGFDFRAGIGYSY